MSLILSIETAVSVCSVALHKEGNLIGLLELRQENVHAQKLMPAISSLFGHAGVVSSDLNAVAVSKGPGSYTGLRIGVSTAKGIAFAHGVPLIGVGSLDALAKQIVSLVDEKAVIIPMIDARRMEVYSKVFDQSLNELESLRPVVVDERSYSQYLENGKVFFLGDAAKKVSEVIKHPNACYVGFTNSAASVGCLAFDKYEKEDFEDIAYFEPNYLKEFRVVKSKKNPLSI